MPTVLNYRHLTAWAQTVIAVGVAARAHYLLTYHATSAARPGLLVVIALAVLLALVSLGAALGLIRHGPGRMYAGAALYAGIAVLLALTYHNSPWDIQVGNAFMFGGLAVSFLVALIGFRKGAYEC